MDSLNKREIYYCLFKEPKKSFYVDIEDFFAMQKGRSMLACNVFILYKLCRKNDLEEEFEYVLI